MNIEPMDLQNLITAGVLAALVPLEERMNTRFDARFDAMETRIDILDNMVRRQSALQSNSTKNRSELLEIVPRLDGENPQIVGIDYPPTLNHLLVAGNERTPLGDMNTWSKYKSKALLDFYGADDGYDSESMVENTPTARIRRLKLAKIIGITPQQIQTAYSSFGDV